jgi:hypothetical protein
VARRAQVATRCSTRVLPMLSRLTVILCLALPLCVQAQSAFDKDADLFQSLPTIDEAQLLRSFLPKQLERLPVRGGSGNLYCSPGACQLVPKKPEEADLPEFLTTHAIRLGRGAGALEMDCMQRVQAPIARDNVSLGHYVDRDRGRLVGGPCSLRLDGQGTAQVTRSIKR